VTRTTDDFRNLWYYNDDRLDLKRGKTEMKVLRVVGMVIAVLLVAAIGVYAWASYAAARKLSRVYPVHSVGFSVVSQQQAVERGRHLVESRYGCSACHGSDFGGGVMIDNAAIGSLLGPNLTTGKGSATLGYSASDWDRIVRHGVKRDGTPALMPSQDYRQMTDQELSDIVAFIRSRPGVDKRVPPPALGPAGKVLVATGKFTLSADVIGSHDKRHAASPPPAEVSVDFGRHMAGACMGCHRSDLGGGTIVGGDPAWPPAANLTPGPDGLGAWTFPQFVRAMREGKRPDGTALRPPMSELIAYTQKMTDVEVQALWSYLRSVPAVVNRE
jgi:mono/diheme cytochrome c family protein